MNCSAFSFLLNIKEQYENIENKDSTIFMILYSSSQKIGPDNLAFYNFRLRKDGPF